MDCNRGIPGFRDKSIAFWMRLLDERRGGFSFTSEQPATLMATAYSVLGLEFVGSLRHLNEKQRSSVISFLMKGVQRDGSFIDPLFSQEDIMTKSHDITYFREETTAFCQQALDALLAPPPVPRRFPTEWLTGDGMLSYFESFPWENPWLDSNRVMFVLSQMCHDVEKHQKGEYLSLIDRALDWIDTNQSEETGLWAGPHEVPLDNAMAATFHFTFFYYYRRRAIKYPAKIIDSCLSLQMKDGLFSGKNIGHTCLDYDALDLMAKASLSTKHRSNEVQDAMMRAHARLMELYDHENGGFFHCKERVLRQLGRRGVRLIQRVGLSRCVSQALPSAASGIYHTGHQLLSCDTSRGNAFSTWFRLLALYLACQRQWMEEGPRENIVFRRLPFLGYHDPLAIQLAHGVMRTSPFERDSKWPPMVRDATLSEKPLISVIVPAYNAENCLPTALSSVRAQVYPFWECIIVNDGSTDRTSEIAHKWSRSDSRFKVIDQKNLGLGAARNAGLEVARGKYVHCLDADDRISPDFYFQLVAKMLSMSNSQALSCAISSMITFRNAGYVLSHQKAIGDSSYDFKELAKANFGPPLTYFFQRDILKVTGSFDEDLLHCHDWDLWLRFARSGVQFIPVTDAIAFYQVKPGSLSTRFVPFVDAVRKIILRAGEIDTRCNIKISGSDPIDLSQLENTIIRNWYGAMLRSINSHNINSANELFHWAREYLPLGVWKDPGSFGLRPYFNWTDNPPPLSKILESGWDRMMIWLDVMSRNWPELPQTKVFYGVAPGIVKIRIAARSVSVKWLWGLLTVEKEKQLLRKMPLPILFMFTVLITPKRILRPAWKVVTSITKARSQV